MALSLELVQKQTQRLIMTPQMQQSIQLLQMNALELEQLVEQELLENPFLELAEEGPADSDEDSREPESPGDNGADALDIEIAESELPEDRSEALNERLEIAADPLELDSGDSAAEPEAPEKFEENDVDWDDLFSDSENAVYSPPHEDVEERDFTEYTAARSSLADYLTWQLRLSTLEGLDAQIGEFLIGCLDEDGYLSEPLERIAEELRAPLEDVQRVLAVLQTFDPPGVFARDLPECLLLQLEDLGEKTPLAAETLQKHFDLLYRKKFREIAKETHAEEQEIIDLFNRIRRLEPKPGRSRSKEQTRYIAPDVYVREIDGRFIYSLNEGGSSGLRVSRFYRDMFSDRNGSFSSKEKEYAKERLRSAVMLMKNIEKRKSTILRVTEAIMEHQMDFLKKGIAHLRPLTLREIAEKVEMHEATISRVTSGKYVETPQGLFELKFFFSSGIDSSMGDAASSRSIKDLIADMIANENPKKPLSDEKIAKSIQAKGFQIARRTVAKYREQMKILPAKMRKETL